MDNVTQPQDSFTVTLNGKPRAIPAGWTVAELLADLELKDRLVVVERNGAILQRAAFVETELTTGDVLEIVHFVGGG